jgi:hypothetical protein
MAITKASEVINLLDHYSHLAVKSGLLRTVFNIHGNGSYPPQYQLVRDVMVRLWSTYGMEPMGAVLGNNEYPYGGYAFGKEGNAVGVVFCYDVEAKSKPHSFVNDPPRRFVCIHTTKIQKDREPTNFYRSGTAEGLMSIIKKDKDCLEAISELDYLDGLVVSNIKENVSIGSENFDVPNITQEHVLDLLDLMGQVQDGSVVNVSTKLKEWESKTRGNAAKAIENRRENLAIKNNFYKSSLVISEIPYICDHKYHVREITIEDGSVKDVRKEFMINEIKELANDYPSVFGIHNMLRAASIDEGLMGGHFSFSGHYDPSFNVIKSKLGLSPFYSFSDSTHRYIKFVNVPTNLHTSQQKEEAREDENIAPSIVPRSKSSFF